MIAAALFASATEHAAGVGSLSAATLGLYRLAIAACVVAAGWSALR